ncbi:MAG: hypothetical protein P4L99_13255 [Chthoniobacter sp.]|nr:hypothetical protein [Chthoniobacter sp.]
MLPPIKYTVILPAGEYRPLYEDDQYYYYQGPAKVIYRGAMDVGSSLFDGGITVTRGSRTPGGWYFVNEDGSQSVGQFTTSPPTR